MTKTLLAASVAAVLTLIASAATAQSSTRGMRADADADGRISRAEFLDGRLARLSAVDANRDGTISAEERRSGMDTRRNQRVSDRFERLDVNGDGAVSREEFVARRARPERAARAGLHRAWRMSRRGGSNGQRAGREVQIAQVRARMEATFARLDADRDGYLTQGERQVARQAMREHRRERRAANQAGRPSPSAAPSE